MNMITGTPTKYALSNLRRNLRVFAVKIASRVSPVFLAKYRYRAQLGRWPDLHNPKTFDEKLLWLMLYWRHPLKTICGDKYSMRSYIAEKNLEYILPELYGVYEKSSEIDFESLPPQFVLKCTHGCHFNIICQDKNLLDIHETQRKLDEWMATDYSTVAGELHYASMTPRIICERYLGDANGNLPNDFKIYCFGGQAFCILVCFQRGSDGHAKSDFYNREWNNKLLYSKANTSKKMNFERPESLDEMITIAEKLAQPFPFVRVDFYCIDGKITISEMTFTPSGCVDIDYPEIAQQELGELIILPEKLT